MRLGWIVPLLVLAGCGSGDKPMTKGEAEDKIFAPTDIESMTPEMKAKIPANGLGPAGTTTAKLPGATPPANL
jgi:hypothetical protein